MLVVILTRVGPEARGALLQDVSLIQISLNTLLDTEAEGLSNAQPKVRMSLAGEQAGEQAINSATALSLQELLNPEKTSIVGLVMNPTNPASMMSFLD